VHLSFACPLGDIKGFVLWFVVAQAFLVRLRLHHWAGCVGVMRKAGGWTWAWGLSGSEGLFPWTLGLLGERGRLGGLRAGALCSFGHVCRTVWRVVFVHSARSLSVCKSRELCVGNKVCVAFLTQMPILRDMEATRNLKNLDWQDLLALSLSLTEGRRLADAALRKPLSKIVGSRESWEISLARMEKLQARVSSLMASMEADERIES
jgi:hypothetical protein